MKNQVALSVRNVSYEEIMTNFSLLLHEKSLARCTNLKAIIAITALFAPSVMFAQAQAPQIQTAMSSQDPSGMSREDMTIAFLRNLETYTRVELDKKNKAYLEAHGKRNMKIELKVDGIYLEAGGQKLAIIKVSDQTDTSRSVFVTGFAQNELRRVACFRASREPIPISYGPCGDKIQEAFGVTLVR